MIKDTDYNLKLQQQRIDEKINQFRSDTIATSSTSINLEDERKVTEQCLGICEDARSYIDSLLDRESPLLQDASLSASKGPTFEAQLKTRQALDGNQDKLAEAINHLRRRLDSLVHSVQNDLDTEDERQRLLLDINTSKQCLDICKLASEVSRQKVYDIEEVIASADSRAIIVTNLADVFDTKNALSKGKSAQQSVGSITDERLRLLAEERYSSRFGALVDNSKVADTSRANRPSVSEVPKSQYGVPSQGTYHEQSPESKTQHSRPDVDEMRQVFDSDSEDAESIFSIGSIVSSVTSVGASFLPDESVGYLVDFLFCTAELSPVYAAAIQDIAIGSDRLQRNVRRIISRYGKALKSETSMGNDCVAARLLESRSVAGRAARQIVSQSGSASLKSLNMSLSQGQNYQSDASEDSFDEEETEPVPGKDELRAIKELLLNSQAYTQFKAELLDFVHSPYEKRIRRSIECVSDTEGGLSRTESEVLCREITWVPTNLFQFCMHENLGISNYLKAWIEDEVGETWDWWPLQERKHPVQVGYLRVKWQTVSYYVCCLWPHADEALQALWKRSID